MAKPDPSDAADHRPPPEEIEMAAEEFLGRPLAGNPADRKAALEKRIRYLEGEINLIRQGGLKETDAAAAPLFADLAEARKQLSEWTAQHDGRN